MYEDTEDRLLAALLTYNQDILNNPEELPEHRNTARRWVIEIQSEQRRRRIEAKPSLVQSALLWMGLREGGDQRNTAHI